MSTNVILLRQNSTLRACIPEGLPPTDGSLAVSIPPELARSIRLIAGMHSKDPQEFLIDWLKSGFSENAA